MKPRNQRSFSAAHRSADHGDAFIPDAARFLDDRLDDDDAESCAEEFIASITGAEFISEDARNETIDEEVGGPFLVQTAPVGEKGGRKDY